MPETHIMFCIERNRGFHPPQLELEENLLSSLVECEIHAATSLTARSGETGQFLRSTENKWHI